MKKSDFTDATWTRSDSITIGIDDGNDKAIPSTKDISVRDMFVWDRRLNGTEIAKLTYSRSSTHNLEPNLELMDVVFESKWNGSVQSRISFENRKSYDNHINFYLNQFPNISLYLKFFATSIWLLMGPLA